MNGLITINFDEQTISARELHEKLGIETPYHKWFPRMCEYGFEEGNDYRVTDKNVHNSNGGRQSISDAEITVSMAKELCMIQRTPEGKKIRQYLIKVEEAWNKPEMVMARALKMASEEIDRIKADNRVLIEDNERMKPKEVFADAVTASDNSILIRDLAPLTTMTTKVTGKGQQYFINKFLGA